MKKSLSILTLLLSLGLFSIGGIVGCGGDGGGTSEFEGGADDDCCEDCCGDDRKSAHLLRLLQSWVVSTQDKERIEKILLMLGRQAPPNCLWPRPRAFGRARHGRTSALAP